MFVHLPGIEDLKSLSLSFFDSMSASFPLSGCMSEIATESRKRKQRNSVGLKRLIASQAPCCFESCRKNYGILWKQSAATNLGFPMGFRALQTPVKLVAHGAMSIFLIHVGCSCGCCRCDGRSGGCSNVVPESWLLTRLVAQILVCPSANSQGNKFFTYHYHYWPSLALLGKTCPGMPKTIALS